MLCYVMLCYEAMHTKFGILSTFRLPCVLPQPATTQLVPAGTGELGRQIGWT